MYVRMHLSHRVDTHIPYTRLENGSRQTVYRRHHVMLLGSSFLCFADVRGSRETNTGNVQGPSCKQDLCLNYRVLLGGL